MEMEKTPDEIEDEKKRIKQILINKLLDNTILDDEFRSLYKIAKPAEIEDEKKRIKQTLINKLLDNTILHGELKTLCKIAKPEDLNELVVRVFDMNEPDLLKQTNVTGFTAYLNKKKNNQRKSRYEKKIRSGDGKFRNKADHYIVLAEGDSWFNYPLLLSDVLDWVSMEPNIALYSLASGADWFLNMISQREYVAGLGIHNPHYLLLSGGGNDIVGLSRIAVIVDKDPDGECYRRNDWVQKKLMKRYYDESDNSLPKCNSFSKDRIGNGVKHLNKDFYALLMLFKVQYHYIIRKLIEGEKGENGSPDKPSKYPDLTIITQGYDYPIPDSSDGMGFNLAKWYVPLLRQVNHGKWIQMPLSIKGVPKANHNDVMYAMIFLFNEMMIDVADDLNNQVKEKGKGPRVFHIDNRGIVDRDGWTDELHPTPGFFKRVALLYIKCINKIPPLSNKEFIYSKEDLN